jgi:hypothetical protein
MRQVSIREFRLKANKYLGLRDMPIILTKYNKPILEIRAIDKKYADYFADDKKSDDFVEDFEDTEDIEDISYEPLDYSANDDGVLAKEDKERCNIPGCKFKVEGKGKVYDGVTGVFRDVIMCKKHLGESLESARAIE